MAGGLGVAEVALLLAREDAEAARGTSAEAPDSHVDDIGAGDLAVASQRELGWEGLVEHARALGPDPALADLDDLALEVAVHARAVEASVALARLFEVLAEFVVRGIWADQGCRTPGAWLSWKLGVGASTAREWVRVAVRLRELPLIAGRFADGTLSYSKVRALTRIALPEMQDWLLRWADHGTAAELEHIARQLRNAQQGRHADPDDDGHDPGWDLTVRSVAGGRAELRLVGPAEEIFELEERCRRAAQTRRTEMERSAAAEADGSASAEAVDGPDDEQVERSPVVTGAELGAAVADAILAGTADNPPDTSGLDRHTLVLHTPAEALAGASAEAAGQPVPVRDSSGRIRSLDRRVLRRLACEAGIVVAVLDAGGSPLDVGRRRRQVSAALRRAVLLRDRQSCRFPGCGTTRNLHVHHIEHWADGGPTVRDNLVTLCAHHHRHLHACHDAGRPWTIRLAGDGDHAFSAHRDPTPVPHAGPTRRIGDAVAEARRAAAGSASAEAGAVPGRAAATRAVSDGRPGPHAPFEWDGPGHYDLDLAVAVLQQHLDDVLPPGRLTMAA